MFKKMLLLSGLALLTLNGAVSAEEEKEPTLIVQYDDEEEQDNLLVSDDKDQVEESILVSDDSEKETKSLLAYDDEQDYESDEEYELV